MRTESSCSDTSDCSNENRKAGAGRNGRKSNAILARPTSPGYWLCCLLPLSLATHYVHSSSGCLTPPTYGMLTIAAMGMCIESLCFFMYMFLKTGLLLKLLISFVPGLLTTLLFMKCQQYSLTFGIFWGFAVTFCYQNVYIRVMRGLPHCFSFGEAAVLVQGLMLFVLNALLQLPIMLLHRPSRGDFEKLNIIMMSALFCLLAACLLLTFFQSLRQPLGFYMLMVLLVIAVTCMPVTEPLPVVTLFNFIVKDITRLKIVAFYLALVGATIAVVCWQLRNTQKASTRMRKIFHFLIVFVYIPGLLFQCAFLYIASGVALAIFTVLELFRVLKIPPLADGLKLAFASFSDEKDAGMLALTPFCLLIGCSLPIWISPCPCGASNEVANARLIPLMAGILSIGFGDTAASIIGSKFGRLKWPNSSRTVEGSLAFVLTIELAVLSLHLSGYIPLSHSQWIYIHVATFAVAVVEALTDQIDNLVLPLVFYAIVNCA